MGKSDFKTKILPKILYAAGTVLTAAGIAAKCILQSDVFDAVYVIFICALGLIGGVLLIRTTLKKIVSNRDFFALKGTIIFCWVCSFFVIATASEFNWVFIICLPICAGCISYLPSYYKHCEQLREDSVRRTNEALMRKENSVTVHSNESKMQ